MLDCRDKLAYYLDIIYSVHVNGGIFSSSVSFHDIRHLFCPVNHKPDACDCAHTICMIRLKRIDKNRVLFSNIRLFLGMGETCQNDAQTYFNNQIELSANF